MKDEITARDRIEGFRVAREAEELATRATWAAWLLRPLARLLRHISSEDPSDDRHINFEDY